MRAILACDVRPSSFGAAAVAERAEAATAVVVAVAPVVVTVLMVAQMPMQKVAVVEAGGEVEREAEVVEAVAVVQQAWPRRFQDECLTRFAGPRRNVYGYATGGSHSLAAVRRQWLGSASLAFPYSARSQ